MSNKIISIKPIKSQRMQVICNACSNITLCPIFIINGKVNIRALDCSHCGNSFNPLTIRPEDLKELEKYK